MRHSLRGGSVSTMVLSGVNISPFDHVVSTSINLCLETVPGFHIDHWTSFSGVKTFGWSYESKMLLFGV